VSGSPDCMAPKQVRGRAVDGRAGLYSLGCVLYEMLTGERVFLRATPMAAALAHADEPAPSLSAAFPQRLRRVVAQLLEKDPTRRPNTASEVVSDLTALPARKRISIASAMAVAAGVVASPPFLFVRPAPNPAAGAVRRTT